MWRLGASTEVLVHPVTSHLFLLLLFTLCVSSVMAMIQKDELREQVRLGLTIAGGFMAVALVLGWLMYPFPL
jgi:hypothetical protein